MTLERLERGLFAVKWLAPPLALAVAAAVGYRFGFGAGLLTLAGGALLLVIGLFWQSLQSLAGESVLSLDEALSLGAPTAEEEQKRAVLRALKDLEYERSVGKITDVDYDALSARYRTEAKRLIRALDDELAPARERVESLLERRLSRARIPAKASDRTSESDTLSPSKVERQKPALAQSTLSSVDALIEEAGPAAISDAAESGAEVKHIEISPERTSEVPSPAPRKRGVSRTGTLRSRDVRELLEPGDRASDEPRSAPQSAGSGTSCRQCNTLNDPDARFCKRCGQQLATAGPP
jgi:hypothetical protein